VHEQGAEHTRADVRLEHVTKLFDQVTAVDDLTLEVAHGAFFALLGASGCGKTTTLRMIGGFEEPTAGTILLGGTDVTGLPPYKRDVNTVFQSYALFPHRNVGYNVAFGLRRKGVAAKEAAARVSAILRIVDLEGYEGRMPQQLSGGQQQRIALARALVNRPQVLLLDEPLGALDLKLRKQMQLELKSIQNEMGVTFVHVTHDQEEAMTMADQIAVMNRGRVEQLGRPEELYERPRTAFVASFLGVSNLIRGKREGSGAVRTSGGVLRVRADDLDGRNGRVAVGVRPEKIRLGTGEENVLEGRVAERAYVGVSTQYVIDTPAGRIQVYVQNTEPGAGMAAPGDAVSMSFGAESTFVVDAPADGEEASQ
jgi:spermidine/putrescine transport system ATP-binding protein